MFLKYLIFEKLVFEWGTGLGSGEALGGPTSRKGILLEHARRAPEPKEKFQADS